MKALGFNLKAGVTVAAAKDVIAAICRHAAPQKKPVVLREFHMFYEPPNFWWEKEPKAKDPFATVAVGRDCNAYQHGGRLCYLILADGSLAWIPPKVSEYAIDKTGADDVKEHLEDVEAEDALAAASVDCELIMDEISGFNPPEDESEELGDPEDYPPVVKLEDIVRQAQEWGSRLAATAVSSQTLAEAVREFEDVHGLISVTFAEVCGEYQVDAVVRHLTIEKFA